MVQSFYLCTVSSIRGFVVCRSVFIGVIIKQITLTIKQLQNFIANDNMYNEHLKIVDNCLRASHPFQLHENSHYKLIKLKKITN